MKNLLVLIPFVFQFLSLSAQLVIDIYPTEEYMISNMLIGNKSVKISNVNFVGAHEARGVFWSKSTPIPLDSGIILSTGKAIGAIGPNKGAGFTGSNNTKGDADLKALANNTTYDATYLEFDFTAKNSIIKFDYVFASEEYPEYVGSSFNDVFGFFLTDLETGVTTNLAVIPVTNEPITVNNINDKVNSNFYIENTLDPGKVDYLIEFDGLTKSLLAFSKVTPGKKYHIKISISDVGDAAFDSAVFLKGKSFSSITEETLKTDYIHYFNAFNSHLNSEESTPIPDTLPTTSIKKEQETSLNAIDSVLIYFDFDSISPIQSSLNSALKKIKKYQNQLGYCTIVGHTDNKGNLYYNQKLSENRANYIANILKQQFEFKISMVEGKAFKYPVRYYSYPTKQPLNRRVIIYLFPKKN